MTQIKLSRETLLKPLQLVLGAVEKRQTLPILAHVLFCIKNNHLFLTATDMELELVGHVALTQPHEDFETTIPARKLLDICRSLPDMAEITLTFDGQRLILKSGRSRFTLATLPAQEFPKVEKSKILTQFSISQHQLKHLLDKTQFAMAQQDVRYYLNGLLFDIQKSALTVVATDGHRLALSSMQEGFKADAAHQIIVPRKAIMELIRLLEDSDELIEIAISTNHFHATTPHFIFTSKLVDGKFPDFNRVIPKNLDKNLSFDRDILKQALNRVSILCNEKYHSVRILLDNQIMLVAAHNPDHEEAEEELEVNYQNEKIELGFNVNYILDVLNTLPAGNIQMSFINADLSVVLQHQQMPESLYVVMPMRL